MQKPIEIWKNRFANLLDEVPVSTVIDGRSDEATQDDYEVLRQHIDPDDMSEEGFWVRPQIRREGAPRIVTRNIPGWMLNADAVRSLLHIQFPKLAQHWGDYVSRNPDNSEEFINRPCACRECKRARRGATLWWFIVHLLRTNLPAEHIAQEWNDVYQPKRKLTAAYVRRNIQRMRALTAPAKSAIPPTKQRS